MIITAGQIIWTSECEKALADPDEAKVELKALKRKWVSYLNKLTAITRSKLNKIERNKVRGGETHRVPTCLHTWVLCMWTGAVHERYRQHACSQVIISDANWGSSPARMLVLPDDMAATAVIIAAAHCLCRWLR
jgi:hypothetical protein